MDMKKRPNDHTAAMPHMTVRCILLFLQRCRLVTNSGPLMLNATRLNMSWVNGKELFHSHTAGHILEVNDSSAKDHCSTSPLCSMAFHLHWLAEREKTQTERKKRSCVTGNSSSVRIKFLGWQYLNRKSHTFYIIVFPPQHVIMWVTYCITYGKTDEAAFHHTASWNCTFDFIKWICALMLMIWHCIWN